MTLLLLTACIGLAVTLFIWGFVDVSAPAVGKSRDYFTERAEVSLTEMFLFINPAPLFYIYASALIILPALIWLLTGNPVFAAATLVVVFFLPRKIYKHLHARRIRRFHEQLPDGLRMMAASMQAGAGLNPALESLVDESGPPLSQEFSIVLREQRLGVDVDESFQNVAERVDLPDFDLFVAALRISREVGGNLAESLLGVSETVRRRLTTEGKVKALTSQGRMQAFVMAFIPIGIGAFLAWRYPDFGQALLHTHLGWGVLTLGAIMEILGFRMCKKIADIDI